jgi:ribosomal protein S18 acetylase RimI-like enzyme
VTTGFENDILIRPMSTADIPDVVALQVAFLEGSIVTELGAGFLARFHALALAQPSTLAFVAVQGPAIVGFAVSSLDVDAFNQWVKPRLLPSLLRSVAAPRQWRLWPSIARSVIDRAPQPPIPAELLLLVVDSRARRRGGGRRLVDALERAFSDAGVTRYRVAVRSHLEVARAFYLSRGFMPEQQRTVLGHPMTYLTKQVPVRP